MKNRLCSFTCCELWASHSVVKDSKNQQLSPLKISAFLTFHTSLIRELKNTEVLLLIWWLLTEMAGLVSIYSLCLISLKILSFLKSILILFGAYVLKKKKWWGRRKWWIFFSSNGKFRRSKDLYKEPYWMIFMIIGKKNIMQSFT